MGVSPAVSELKSVFLKNIAQIPGVFNDRALSIIKLPAFRYLERYRYGREFVYVRSPLLAGKDRLLDLCSVLSVGRHNNGPSGAEQRFVGRESDHIRVINRVGVYTGHNKACRMGYIGKKHGTCFITYFPELRPVGCPGVGCVPCYYHTGPVLNGQIHYCVII